MKLHRTIDAGLSLSSREAARLLESLRFTERTLCEAADLTFETEVRRRILRAADRLERAIDELSPNPSIVLPDSMVAI